MSYNGVGEDRFERLIAFLAALRQMGAGGSESTIHTQEGVTVRSRFLLPLLQALSLWLSFCGMIGGIMLMTWGVSWLLDLDWDPRSYVLAWCLAALVAWGVAWAVSRFLAEQVQTVQALAVVVGTLVLGVALGSLALTARTRFGAELAALVVGAGLILASVAWGYNQALDLVQPYWRRSPFEQAITNELLPALSRFIMAVDDGEAPTARTEDPRWRARSRRPGFGDWGEPEEEPEEEPVEIEPEAGNLIWFVRYAARLPSLSLADLTVRPAPTLPFPEDGRERRLRRDMIRRLLARGSTEDEVRVDGNRERGLGAGGFWDLRGQGATAEWAVPRDEALRRTERMWRSVMGEEPIPDHWSEQRKAA